MQKKKILLIATWWTFASIKTNNGLKPNFKIKELLKFFPESAKIADIDCIQLCNLDSTNLHPDHWTQMADMIAKNYNDYDGFVVTHWTDTMQYSAAALSFALKGLLKPVIFTWSVLWIEEHGTDAKINFIDSIRVASSDLVKEVAICFHHDIIKGTRARKVTNEATKITNEKMGIYSSINLHLIGNVVLWKIISNKIYFTKNTYPKHSELLLLPKFNNNIWLIKLYPWIGSDVLNCYKSNKAIVIEAFGPGNIPFKYSWWIDKIKELVKNQTMVFITTQNSFGEVDMKKYEVWQKAEKAWAIPCYDMIPETVIIKLMWIFGNFPSYNKAQVKKLFLTNICWEISNINKII